MTDPSHRSISPAWAIPACLLLTSALVHVPAATAAAKTNNAAFVTLGHATNGGDNRLDVVVTVASGVPNARCRGRATLADLHPRDLPVLRTGASSGAKWRWEIAPGAPAGRMRITVTCHVDGRDKTATTTFDVRKGPPAARSARQFVGFGTMSTSTWKPPVTKDGSGTGAANLYPSGQCTWFVAALRTDLPYFAEAAGDAKNWATSAARVGWPVDGAPQVGDVAVFQPNQYRAGYMGHVAFVERVLGDQVSVLEANLSGDGSSSRRTVPIAGLKFIHQKAATAATGSPPGGSLPGGGHADNGGTVGDGNANNGGTVGNGNANNGGALGNGNVSGNGTVGNGNASGNGTVGDGNASGGSTAITNNSTTSTTCTTNNNATVDNPSNQTSSNGSNTNNTTNGIVLTGCSL